MGSESPLSFGVSSFMFPAHEMSSPARRCVQFHYGIRLLTLLTRSQLFLYFSQCFTDTDLRVQASSLVYILRGSMTKSCSRWRSRFHSLFSGKTSTIVAAAKRMYGTKAYKSMTLELNASDARGIDVRMRKLFRLGIGLVDVEQ
jgi:hypothetical protein